MNKRSISWATWISAWGALALLAMTALAGAQEAAPADEAPQHALGVPELDTAPELGVVGCNCYEDSYACGSQSCCPTWSFYAGATILNRSNPGGNPLIQDTTNVLYGSDLDLGWQSGYEFELTRHNVTGQDALVARVLVVDGWSATTIASLTGNPQVNTIPAVTMTGPRDVLANLSSEFISFELNYVWESQWCPALKWLTGFRTVEIDETMSATLVFPPGGTPTAYHSVETRNRLYGFQAGADLSLYSGSVFSLRGICNAGIYGNATYQRSGTWDDATAPISVTGSDSTAALVSELGLSGKYILIDGISLRTDYRVLWASGLALAPEQVPVTNFTLGSGIDSDATAFYHGVFVGLECAY